MIKKIVVPLDGSKIAEVALPYAGEVGAKTGSDIILLTVLQSEETYELKEHYIYTKKIEELTKYYADKYNKNGRGKAIEVMTVTRTGNPAEGIIDYTSKSGFPLIIMASHGRSGIGRWAVGSVAEKVAKYSRWQPVMLIRTKEAHSDTGNKRLLKKVLVPLDGSIESEAVIPPIMEIAHSLQMEITFLQVIPGNNHIHADAEAYLKRVCSRLKDKSVTVNYKVNIGDTAENIIDLADEHAFDIVAMSTKDMNQDRLWIMGSVAQKVFLGGNTPLLLIKN
jgi:nucleotide-binding universal stress UspA family protein